MVEKTIQDINLTRILDNVDREAHRLAGNINASAGEVSEAVKDDRNGDIANAVITASALGGFLYANHRYNSRNININNAMNALFNETVGDETVRSMLAKSGINNIPEIEEALKQREALLKKIKTFQKQGLIEVTKEGVIKEKKNAPKERVNDINQLKNDISENLERTKQLRQAFCEQLTPESLEIIEKKAGSHEKEYKKLLTEQKKLEKKSTEAGKKLLENVKDPDLKARLEKGLKDGTYKCVGKAIVESKPTEFLEKEHILNEMFKGKTEELNRILKLSGAERNTQIDNFVRNNCSDSQVRPEVAKYLKEKNVFVKDGTIFSKDVVNKTVAGESVLGPDTANRISEYNNATREFQEFQSSRKVLINQAQHASKAAKEVRLALESQQRLATAYEDALKYGKTKQFYEIINKEFQGQYGLKEGAEQAKKFRQSAGLPENIQEFEKNIAKLKQKGLLNTVKRSAAATKGLTSKVLFSKAGRIGGSALAVGLLGYELAGIGNEIVHPEETAAFKRVGNEMAKQFGPEKTYNEAEKKRLIDFYAEFTKDPKEQAFLQEVQRNGYDIVSALKNTGRLKEAKLGGEDDVAQIYAESQQGVMNDSIEAGVLNPIEKLYNQVNANTNEENEAQVKASGDGLSEEEQARLAQLREKAENDPDSLTPEERKEYERLSAKESAARQSYSGKPEEQADSEDQEEDAKKPLNKKEAEDLVKSMQRLKEGKGTDEDKKLIMQYGTRAVNAGVEEGVPAEVIKKLNDMGLKIKNKAPINTTTTPGNIVTTVPGNNGVTNVPGSNGAVPSGTNGTVLGPDGKPISTDTIPAAVAQAEQQSWWSKYKAWIIGLGVLLLGAAAAILLIRKEKKKTKKAKEEVNSLSGKVNELTDELNNLQPTTDNENQNTTSLTADNTQTNSLTSTSDGASATLGSAGETVSAESSGIAQISNVYSR